MIKYQILQGVRLPQATGLPSVVLTPEGRAMGAIPGWQMLIDPDYVSGASARNRAVPNSLLPPALNPAGFSVFPGSGATAFSLTPGSNQTFPTNLAIDGDAWSVFTVARGDFSSAGAKHIISPLDTGSPYNPTIGFNSSGTNAAVLGAPTGIYRIQYSPPQPFEGRTALVIWTFSTREGLRVFHNGGLGAHEPDETQPFSHSASAGGWRIFNGSMGGLVGMTGFLSIDLGWPEHAGYRRAIERFLMDKYGIS